MAEKTGFDPGVPCWVDLEAPDVPAARRFYGELFGWEFADLGEDAGHYTMASKGGRLVAALSAPTAPGPGHWTTYVDVEDAEAAGARAGAAGGRVLAGPMRVMEAGSMVVLADPSGAVVAGWQPAAHTGAQLVDEPGTLVWNELQTGDLDRARSFYAQVFGWGWAGQDGYAEAQVAGRTVAGAMPRPADLPPEVPDHWLVYFGSADLDGDVARAQALGATLLVEPRDVPGTGRFAVVADPQGAAFGLFQG